MPSPNGVASLGARRLRVAYETKTYEIETPDGETVALTGYKCGAGCPISVEIDVESAWAEWSEDIPTDEESGSLGDPKADPPIPPTPGTLTAHRYMAKKMRADRLVRRNLLCAVMPGLDQSVADVLAADAGPWKDILNELGWWDQTEESTEGEAIAGDSSLPTGPDESPAGPPVTATTPSTPVPDSA